MKIKSLVSENNKFLLVEVEMTLLPGLPQIHFLGLPDQVIRESEYRIRSALKMQDFEFPKAYQLIVNIRPTHLKKSSRGLELAIAAGLLLMTEQIQNQFQLEKTIFYGELGLDGEVREPDDLELDTEMSVAFPIVTGQSESQMSPLDRFVIGKLQDLKRKLNLIPKQMNAPQIERPQEFLDYYFPKKQAQLLSVVALGEHSLLLAGPAGSGKTTLAKSMLSFLKEPSAADLNSIKKNFGSSLNWRPLVQPHHSSSPLSLIGGGVPPLPGEFNRADRGILFLDELLEFHPKAQEALREPMEEGKIRISKSNRVAEFKSEPLVIACTNLCPCGDWTPSKKIHCSRSVQRCKDYVFRLSGPVADRFQILFFTQAQSKEQEFSGFSILEKVEKARQFRKSRVKINAKLETAELLRDIDPFVKNNLLPKEFSSRRRELSTLRVARSLADLDSSEKIKVEHIESALDLTWHPFERLKKLD